MASKKKEAKAEEVVQTSERLVETPAQPVMQSVGGKAGRPTPVDLGKTYNPDLLPERLLAAKEPLEGEKRVLKREGKVLLTEGE